MPIISGDASENFDRHCQIYELSTTPIAAPPRKDTRGAMYPAMTLVPPVASTTAPLPVARASPAQLKLPVVDELPR